MDGLLSRINMHQYQEYSVRFIEDHQISAVFLDCGLGKTVITLTAIHDLMYDSFEIHKALIIAPLRVASSTWKDEVS
jgi:ERCC4-related helicase